MKKIFSRIWKTSTIKYWKNYGLKKLVTANQLNSKGFDDIKEDILKMMTIEDLKNITADYKKMGIETSKYKVNFLNKKILNEYYEKENYKQINFKTDKKIKL